MTGDKQQGVLVTPQWSRYIWHPVPGIDYIGTVISIVFEPHIWTPNQISSVPLFPFARWHCVQQYHLKHQKLSAIRPSTLPCIILQLPTSLSRRFAPTPDSCAYFQTSRHPHYSIPEPSRRACEPGSPRLVQLRSHRSMGGRFRYLMLIECYKYIVYIYIYVVYKYIYIGT